MCFSGLDLFMVEQKFCLLWSFIEGVEMSQPKIKRRVGIYEVGRTIGEGSFAKVKFARNSKTGEAVALKIIDKEKVLRHKMAEQVIWIDLFELICW